MAAPATSSGLSAADIDRIRVILGGGRRPRVVFTEAAGQIAGQVGHIVNLTDAGDADEWIVVQFGRDELPFSPSDLTLAARGGARTVPARSPAGRRTLAVDAPTVVPGTGLDAVPAPRKGKRMRANGAVAETFAPGNGSMPAAEAKPVKASKPAKPLAGLVITLAYADREWTLAATQGSRSLAKPYVIKPTDARRMVALIEVPGVHDAVESIIAAERAEAEARALRLRAELAEIEGRLAELTHHG
jgi:hypothetical protein